MKKYLSVLFLGGLFLFLPVKGYAMVQVDENGNAMPTQTKEGEVTILNESVTAPDERNPIVDGDKAVSSDQPVLYDSRQGEDVVKTTSTDKDDLVTTQENTLLSTNTGKGNNMPLYIVLSGLVLGGTSFFIIKKQRAQ